MSQVQPHVSISQAQSGPVIGESVGSGGGDGGHGGHGHGVGDGCGGGSLQDLFLKTKYFSYFLV